MTKKNALPDCCTDALSDVFQPEFFKALCDPTRISIVATLAASGHAATVSDIVDCCGVDFSGVSRHLKILKEAGILAAEREGRHVKYRLETTALSGTLRGMADALDVCRVEEK
ncbi:MAG: ArsR/SmtB family transcription factor [Pseudomonadales bacterium]